jgi:membrane-associated phospholipid phosphatase
MNRENRKYGIAFLLLTAGLFLSGAFIWLFGELAEEVMEKEFALIDSMIIGFLEYTENPFLDSVMLWVTEMGSFWFVGTFTVLSVTILWFKGKDRWGAVFLVIAVGGGGVLTLLLKYVYQRDRPSLNPAIDAVGFSFPSGHSVGALVLYGFILFLIIRSGRNPILQWVSSVLTLLLIIFIGISRIYLGAHFPSDVFAGYIAGAIWLVLCLVALEWIQWQNANPVRPIKAFHDFLAMSFNSRRN